MIPLGSAARGKIALETLGRIAVRHPITIVASWLLLAVALLTALPSLSHVVRDRAVDIFPRDAPGVVSMESMATAFGEDGLDNAALVVMTDQGGLSSADEHAYGDLAQALRRRVADVRSVQDFVATPALRATLASRDGAAYCMVVGLRGVLGSPEAIESYNNVRTRVARTRVAGAVALSVTGPPAAVGDLFEIGESDLRTIEIVTVVMISAIMLIIYRSVTTALVALSAIGISLAVAQGALAGLAEHGMSISVIAVALITAILVGAGTDYTIFIISRYHEYVRDGMGSDAAVIASCRTMGRITVASAATVALAFLAMSLSRLGAFASLGLASAVAIAVACAASVTLLPAVLALAGRRGWVRPRRERTTRWWRRAGIAVVRHPRRWLAVSLLVLAGLAACCTQIRFSYDDRRALPATAPSNVGFAALEQHYSLRHFLPDYVIVTSPTDLRSASALADLEEMAGRISQMDGVVAVRGITRPTGTPISEATVSFQSAEVGRRLGDAAHMIADNKGNLAQLTAGAKTLDAGVAQMKSELDQSLRTLDAITAVLAAVGGGPSIPAAAWTDADAMVDAIHTLGDVWQGEIDQAIDVLGSLDSVLDVLVGSDACDRSPDCARTRSEMVSLAAGDQKGAVASLNRIGQILRGFRNDQPLSVLIDRLHGALGAVTTQLHSLGLKRPSDLPAEGRDVQRGVDQLSAGSRKLADAVIDLVGQTNQIGSQLQQAADYLQQLGDQARNPVMAGFYLPPAAFSDKDFATAARFFLSPDGRSARYLVESALDPYSTDAMDQVTAIERTAAAALPNTALARSTVTTTGFQAINGDLRQYYNHDFLFIAIATITIIFIILGLLLRAVIAPLYMVGSVVLSYLAALGVGVIIFQFIGGRELSWSTPAMAFIILVAVGADYNLLLVSRIREETASGIRIGVIRTVASTGGVITSAGVIFAVSMFGLLFGNVVSMAEVGAIMGLGLLIDTFIVRSVTVPAIATLVGRAGWWPSGS